MNTSNDSGAENSGSQWRILLVISTACLIASLSFNVFIFKQNRTLMQQRQQQTLQLQQVQQADAIIRSIVQDVANFSVQYPEVRGILSKYGINVNVQPAPHPAAAAP